MNNTTSPISSVSSSTLIDAKLEEHRPCPSHLCPNCGHKIDPKPDWIGLPAGVKFDPTDQELIEHLEAKVKAEGLRSHPLIDEFIPTLEGEDGICYTHPEKLPGVTRDGLSKHFFHRPSKAYTTGTRKRRKIQSECDDVHRGETRWHKTGKTRPVMVNGKQKGCKKILVLYTNFGKHRKPEKTNWVMHQYHLGELEEEKEGELVVSKIFYQTQPRQCNLGERSAAAVEVATVERRRGYGGSCSSSKLEGGVAHMSPPPDNFSFAPFRESFNEVAMGEEAVARKEARRDEHGEEEHRGKSALHHLAPPAAAAAAAVFHSTRPVPPISPPFQLSPLQGMEDPYRVSRMLYQADKSQNQQQLLQQQRRRQQEMGSISTAGLEELVMSCTTAGVKGEASMNPHSQETEWQYSYSWSPDNPDHHG